MKSSVSPYKVCITYEFKVNEVWFSILEFDSKMVAIEANVKTHLGGVLLLKKGVWRWDVETFSAEGLQDMANATRKFIRDNGLPEREKAD